MRTDLKIISSVREIPDNARIYIYGAGCYAKVLFVLISKIRRDIKIIGFIDSYKSGRCCRKKIYKFSDFKKNIKENEYDLIIIASIYIEEIVNNLKKERIDKYIIFRNSNPAVYFMLPYSLLDSIKNELFECFISVYDFLVKRKKDKIVIIGEFDGKFAGNCKYLYLSLKNKGFENVFWLVENKDRFKDLKNSEITVLKYFSFKALFCLLSAKFLVVDNQDWIHRYPFMNKLKLKKIHLWHGVGFKQLQEMTLPDYVIDKLSEREVKTYEKRLPIYDMLVTTSEFYANNVFSSIFKIKPPEICIGGYPRNDIFYRAIKGNNIYSDEALMDKIILMKKDDYKIVVYTPTFRDILLKLKFQDVIDFQELNAFLDKNKIIFIIKAHSAPNYNYIINDSDKYKNILIYDNAKDAYPLLKVTDLLITDYSSIYTDFLHTGKPILFFPYDYKEYIEIHRDIQFDYNEMTPGPKAKNDAELKEWIKHFLVDDKDGFEKEREKILNLAFKYKDGNASERIYEEMAGMV